MASHQIFLGIDVGKTEHHATAVGSQIKNARSTGRSPGSGNGKVIWLVGGTNSQIATLVDRASRKVDLVQLADRSAEHLTTALSQRRTRNRDLLRRLAQPMATRHEPKHQRANPPIPPQEN